MTSGGGVIFGLTLYVLRKVNTSNTELMQHATSVKPFARLDTF